MKCSKCGSVAVTKEGDWYKCLECGNLMFDISSTQKSVDSPTKILEQMEKENTVEPPIKRSRKAEKDDNDNADESISRVKQVSEKEMRKKTRNRKEEKPKSKIRDTVDFLLPIVIAVIIAILLKTFVFANAIVPTGSMINTIEEKDRIIASRLAYINDDPERYDIVIFHYPDDETQYFVKRIVGLPGETVEVVEGKVYVTDSTGKTTELRDDFVTNCVPTGNYGPYIVPNDCYFMMGDNRNNSLDSRFWTNKFVAKDKIIGKVKFRYFPSFSKIN